MELALRESPEGAIEVPGLREVEVTSLEDCLGLLQLGDRNRCEPGPKCCVDIPGLHDPGNTPHPTDGLKLSRGCLPYGRFTSPGVYSMQPPLCEC